MSKRYEIEKITDIFQIPEDKFDDFLEDFKTYYSFGIHMTKLIDAIAATGGIKTETVPQKMTWIDDGKHDATVYLKSAADLSNEPPAEA